MEKHLSLCGRSAIHKHLAAYLIDRLAVRRTGGTQRHERQNGEKRQ
jgi:hypothetical protein